MNYSMPVKQPIVITNMTRLNSEYSLLKRRRSTLLEELNDRSPQSQTLQSLRRDELRILNKQLGKIERFLIRYGFIANKGKRI